MRHIKKYKIFLESDDFNIEDGDSPGVKVSKEKMNTIKSQMSEYKSKKSQIDSIYKLSKNNEDITKGLEKILGKTDIQNGKDRNPFLVEYSNISQLKRNIDNLQKDNVNDKLKLDDFQEELKLSTDNNTKESINVKISDIKKRMSERTNNITKIEKNLVDSEKKHKDRMLDMEKDMKEYIENISSSNIK